MRFYAIILALLLSLSFCNRAVQFDGQSPKWGKVRAPIDLQYSSYKWLNAGQQATISFSGSPLVNVDDFSVSVRLPNGLNFIAGNTSLSSGGPLTAGTSLSGTVTVQSNVDGMFYIGLMGQFTSNGRTQANSIAIPVQYGTSEPVLQKTGTITESNDGTRYHEIQAE